MRKHWIDALPTVTGLAAALVDAALGWAGALHLSGPSSALVVACGLSVGRMISLELHRQLLVKGQQSAMVDAAAPAGGTPHGA